MDYQTITQFPSIRALIVDPTSINQNLFCLICQELVVDPKECSQCQNLFCSECITSWLQRGKTCPYNCSNQMQLKNPHRIVREAISQIQIRCQNQGCDEKMLLQNLDSHLLQCQYVITKCPFIDCNFMNHLKQIKIHQQTCQHRTETCMKCETVHGINQQHDCVERLCNKLKQQEQNFLAYQQKTDQAIKDLTTRIIQLENLQKRLNKPKCYKGHELLWIYPKKGIQCESCKQTDDNVRYICEPCQIGYCQKCKIPEFKGDYCPANHQMQFNQKPSKGLKCDFCRTNIYNKGDTAYSDRQCNFDICNTCFLKFR
ncbi:unnamed protein product [Paramecium sonneborni]|uniref:RING-type domain-containing protein n=1 Tax=Paramecium sonneborni TaxID=65129 RepID=A0A8S1R8H3_9CILI|nr:unnamed protein product [Paramecium sonneborni]